MKAKTPTVRKLEKKILSLENDNASLRRNINEERSEMREEKENFKQEVCDVKHSSDEEVKRVLQGQIDWLRSLVEDLTVSPEKMDVILKHRKEEIHMENMNPMMEYHERPKHFKKDKPYRGY